MILSKYHVWLSFIISISTMGHVLPLNVTTDGVICFFFFCFHHNHISKTNLKKQKKSYEWINKWSDLLTAVQQNFKKIHELMWIVYDLDTDRLQLYITHFQVVLFFLELHLLERSQLQLYWDFWKFFTSPYLCVTPPFWVPILSVHFPEAICPRYR